MGSFFPRNSTSWVACTALLLTLCGQASAASPTATPEKANTLVAVASNPFADVPSTSWAFQAVVQLHNDGIITGYPDGYFRGKHSLSRYEVAVLTQRAVDKLEADFSDASKATKINADDVTLIRKLLDAYGTDLADVRKQLAVTKAQTDANTAQLKRANIHVTLFARPGLFSERSSVVDGFGKTATVGPVLYGTTAASQGSNYSLSNANLRSDGTTTHGTGFQTIRIGVDGQLSDQLSYQTQFEDNLIYDSIASTSNTNNTYLRLNTASLRYVTPKGFSVTAGRFLGKNSPIGLLYEDYFNGLSVDYGTKKYSAEIGYSFNAASNSSFNSLNPSLNINQPSQTLFAHGGYKFSNNVTGGASYSSDLYPGSLGFGATGFIRNAATGLAQEKFVGSAPQSAASINAEVRVNAKLSLQGELARHLGKDPYNRSKYVQPSSFWGKAFYGNVTPNANHNYAEAGYIVSGVNGLSSHNSTYGLGDDYQQFYLGSLDGYHLVYLGAHHYLADNASVGLVYQRYALNPGVVLPAAAYYVNTVGSQTFLSRDQGQALFLESKFAF